MTANEARELAREALTKKYSYHFDEIKQEALKGKTSTEIFHSGDIYEAKEVCDFLESFGYQTSINDFKPGGSITVNWGHMTPSKERLQTAKSLLQI